MLLVESLTRLFFHFIPLQFNFIQKPPANNNSHMEALCFYSKDDDT